VLNRSKSQNFCQHSHKSACFLRVVFEFDPNWPEIDLNSINYDCIHRSNFFFILVPFRNRYNRGAPRKSKQKPRKVPAYTRFRSAMKRNCCQVRSFTARDVIDESFLRK